MPPASSIRVSNTRIPSSSLLSAWQGLALVTSLLLAGLAAMPADRNVSRPADAQSAHPYRPSKETAKILDQAASLGAVEGGKKPSKKRAPSSAAAPWARSSNHPSLRVSAEPSSRGPSLPAGQDIVDPPVVAASTSAALDPPTPSGFVVPASPELGLNSFVDSVMDELYPANEPSTTLAAPSLSGPSASLPQGQTNGDGLASTVQPGYFDPSSDLLRPCCKRCAKHYYDDPTQICAPPVGSRSRSCTRCVNGHRQCEEVRFYLLLPQSPADGPRFPTFLCPGCETSRSTSIL